MRDSHADAQFVHYEGSDPALPGDPWSRLRYHYGQLLGADDFQAEQNAMVLRRRLHNALLHGLGTVCGLRVSAQPEDPPQTRLVVGAGLAIDVYGREIYVNEPQCLDIAGLHASDVWQRLSPAKPKGSSPLTPEGGLSPATPEGGLSPASPEGLFSVKPKRPSLTDARRAYVTLCYESCLSNQVPAITPPCENASEALAFSRVNDRFRIDLVADAPDDPDPLQRAWWPPGTAVGHGDLRARLLDFLLDSPGNGLSLQQFWTATEGAPLLLAVVDLVHEETADGKITRILTVDNSPRALLPAAQLIAEQVLRQRLAGVDTGQSLKLVSISDNSGSFDANMFPIYTLQFSAELDAATINPDSIEVFELNENGWTTLKCEPKAKVPLEKAITIALKAAPVADTRLQLHLRGDGPKPVMGAAGQPLDGWWDEPVSGAGRGRDVNAIRVWSPRGT